MTKEDKELLLKDLSARLPYGVKFLRESWNFEWDLEMSVIEELEDIDKIGYINNTKVYSIIDIKPYLRPMSSMTEEEKLIYEGLMIGTDNVLYMLDVIDWLNVHHFDYRGLIEKGLAIAVTEDNNPYENQSWIWYKW